MKINCVFDTLDSHSFNRIDEFRKLGYDVNVFAFSRGITPRQGTEADILGTFPNSASYWQKIKVLYPALNALFSFTRKDDAEIWYYSSLQICLLSVFINKNRKYILEESDMLHLCIGQWLLKSCLEYLNKRFIRKSLLSIFTSEGFLHYHFGSHEKWPANVIVIPNKIHPDIINFQVPPKPTSNPHKLRFAFVGYIRYGAVYKLADFITRNYSQHEFHFYGEFLTRQVKENFERLKSRSNVFFHGFFNNPNDLPHIYSNVDVLVAAYDINLINEQYLEPNKLYESIYFRTPLIVSKGTFLACRVEELHCGWAVDTDHDDIRWLVETIQHTVVEMTNQMKHIPQSVAIDDCRPLAEKMSSICI